MHHIAVDASLHGLAWLKDILETSVGLRAESESFLLEAWMAMVGQALVPRGRSWAVRLVSLAAGLFGVVLLAAYTANLAAILTDTSASTSIKR